MTTTVRAPLVPPHTIALAAAQVTGQGLAVVTAALLARRLGVAGFGAYAVVIAVVYVANVATTFGTDMVLIRAIAGDSRLDRCRAALGLQVALSAVAIPALIAAAGLAGLRSAAVVTPLRLYSFTLLPAAFASVATATLRGLGMMRAYAAVVVAAAAVPLVAVAVLVGRGDSMVRVTVVLIGAQVAVAVVATAAAIRPLRRAGTGLVPTSEEVRAMARESRAIGGLGLLGVVYQRAALVVVSTSAGVAAAGRYSGASRIGEAAKVGHLALNGAAYPALVGGRRGVDGGASSERRARYATWWLAVIAAIMLAVGGRALLVHLYGPAFVGARGGLTIVAVGLVPSTVATFESLVLLARHQDRDVLRATRTALVTLGVALAVLVPLLGWTGGCWAMLGADIVQAGLMTSFVRRGGTR